MNRLIATDGTPLTPAKVDYTLIELQFNGVTEYQFNGPDGQPFGPVFKNWDDRERVFTEALHATQSPKPYDYKDEAFKVAVECWTDDETKDIPMDLRLAAAVASRIAEWMQTAADGYRGAELYHNLLEECGKHIGIEAYTDADGAIHEDVVVQKVPDLVKGLTPQKFIPVEVQTPANMQRVLARYEGVYDYRLVTFWQDQANDHYGLPNEADGKGSQPATHWCPLPN